MKNPSQPQYRPIAGLVIWCIKGYQTLLSPWLPRACRYFPSCSAYAIEAVRRHGVGPGVLLGSWRILRCNPWGGDGVDPVPDILPGWLCWWQPGRMRKGGHAAPRVGGSE